MKERRCDVCGSWFIPEHKNQKRCSRECSAVAFAWVQPDYETRQARLKIKQARKRQDKKFTPVEEFIQRHYVETGKLLSYGKAVVLMERKRLNG